MCHFQLVVDELNPTRDYWKCPGCGARVVVWSWSRDRAVRFEFGRTMEWVLWSSPRRGGHADQLVTFE